jgi:hypothetical protein
MTQAIITKIEKGSVALPKTWKGSKVFLRVMGNRATITKLDDSNAIFSSEEIKALRKLGSKISQSLVRKVLKKR